MILSKFGPSDKSPFKFGVTSLTLLQYRDECRHTSSLLTRSPSSFYLAPRNSRGTQDVRTPESRCPNGTRHRYYMQEDDINLGSMPSRSTTTHGYGITISGGKPGPFDEERNVFGKMSGPMSKLERSVEESNSGSEENILPLQQKEAYLPCEEKKGIIRTTEIMISR
jgi:hypothetical protein